MQSRTGPKKAKKAAATKKTKRFTQFKKKVTKKAKILPSDISYTCQLCSKVFYEKAALGGHVSKGHPGQSVSYNKKIEVRKKREFEWKCYKDAKEMYNSTQHEAVAVKDRRSQIKQL